MKMIEAQNLQIPKAGVKRVLTGMRTTGELHLGHYVGALKEWKRIQDEGRYDCFFLLADVQALTTHAEKPELLAKSVVSVVKDWLSVGLDPNDPNIHFVQQSMVPERYELSGLLMMIAKSAEVFRNPTLKSEIGSDKNPTMGFMAYPVDQVADICMVSPTPPRSGDEVLVPVGEDQIPHLEYSRVLARRFNHDYGDVFVPCSPLVGEVGRLVGTDGKEKMSKSMGNIINLSDSEVVANDRVMKMFTDPNHKTVNDPGDTENNPVFIYLRAFDPNKDEVAELTEHYQRGGLGDVAVKRILAQRINEMLDPIRERRSQWEGRDLREIVVDGTEAARIVSRPVVEAVREKMHLGYPD